MRLGHYAPPPDGSMFLLGTGHGNYGGFPAGGTKALLDIWAASPRQTSIDAVYDISGAMTTDPFAKTGSPVLLGGAIHNDGTATTYLKHAGNTPFDSAGPGVDRRTIYVSCRWARTGSEMPFAMGESGAGIAASGNQIYFFQAAGYLRIVSYDTTNGFQTAQATTTISSGDFGADFVIAVEVDGTSKRVYVDGTLEVTDNWIPALGLDGDVYVHGNPGYPMDGETFRVFVDHAPYSATLNASITASIPGYTKPVSSVAALLDLDAAKASFIDLVYDESRAAFLAPMVKSGSPTLSAGEFHFDGTANYKLLRTGETPVEAASTGAGRITVYYAWTATDFAASGFVFFFGSAGFTYHLALQVLITTGVLNTYINNVATAIGQLTAGVQALIALEFDGAQVTCRINGSIVTNTRASIPSTYDLYTSLNHSTSSGKGSARRLYVDAGPYCRALQLELADTHSHTVPEGSTTCLMDVNAADSATIDTVKDSSSVMTTSNATKTGDPTLTGGQFVFDGVLDKLNLAAVPFGTAGTGADRKTIYCAFTATDTSGYTFVLYLHNAAATSYIGLRVSVGSMHVILNSAAGAPTVNLGVITEGVEYVLSVECDGSNANCRLSGGSVVSGVYTGDLTGGSTDVSGTGAVLDGSVRRVYVDGAGYSGQLQANIAGTSTMPAGATKRLMDVRADLAPSISEVYDYSGETQTAAFDAGAGCTLSGAQFVMDGTTAGFLRALSAGSTAPFSTSSAGIGRNTIYVVATPGIGFDDVTRSLFFGAKTSSANYLYLRTQSDGSVYVDGWDGGAITSTEIGALTVGEPAVVSLELDGTDIRCRVSGGTEVTVSGAPDLGGGPWSLGQSSALSFIGTADRLFVDGAAYSAVVMQDLLDDATA